MTDTPRLMISAGESSGDHHAAHVLEALKRRGLRPQAFGMGGPRLAAAGMDTLVDCRDMAIVGLIEVLRHWPRLARNLRLMREQLRARRPDLLILVDYPDFNLKLAQTAREAGIPVLFYVSPQVWAWRPGRVRRIGQLVDMMAVLFPFESAVYEQAGVPVRHVGHPLVDEIRPSIPPESARREFGIDTRWPTVGLLPGSRHGEVQRLLPILLDVARRIRQRRGSVNFLLPVAGTLDPRPIHAAIAEAGLPIRVIEGGRAWDAIQICDAVVTASGTATLEVALMRVPMAVVYRVNWLTYQILRRLVTVEHISLVNIVAGRRVVEEFIQDAARPAAITEEVDRLLDDPDHRCAVLAGLDQVREAMGPGGAADRTAVLVTEMLENPSTMK